MRKSKYGYHGYADDNTIWKSMNARSIENIQNGFNTLKNTIEQKVSYMFANKLGLNDSKSLMIVLGLEPYLNGMPKCGVKIGEEAIKWMDMVKKSRYTVGNAIT